MSLPYNAPAWQLDQGTLADFSGASLLAGVVAAVFRGHFPHKIPNPGGCQVRLIANFQDWQDGREAKAFHHFLVNSLDA